VSVDQERLARVEREDTHREFVRVFGFDPFDPDGSWRAGFDAGVEAQEKRIAYVRDVVEKVRGSDSPRDEEAT
jgi:hypothetical protein